MRIKLAILAIAVMLAMVASTGAHAGVAGFVTISAGDVKHPMDFDLTAQSGSQLVDLESGIIYYDPSTGIDFTGSIPRDVDVNRVGLVHAVGATPAKDSVKPADFDSYSGWTFNVNPMIDPMGRPVPIHIGIVDKKGKRDFLRIFFKITPKSRILGFGPHEAREWITFYCLPNTLTQDQRVEAESALETHIKEDQAHADLVDAAIVTLKANDQVLAQGINDIKVFLRGGQSSSSGSFVIQWTTDSTIFVRVNGKEGTVPGRLMFDRPDGTSNVLYWSTTLKGLRSNPQSCRYTEKAGETQSIPIGGR